MIKIRIQKLIINLLYIISYRKTFDTMESGAEARGGKQGPGPPLQYIYIYIYILDN
jgi:hypothetical protein